eukprot:m.64956 g.64956  ORF g.64956 m.64956 type:complete len:287 (-) comp13516_c1_seq2:436-1296(-)
MSKQDVRTVACISLSDDRTDASAAAPSLPRDALIKAFPFFHGALTRHAAETLLLHGGPGMFLLREVPGQNNVPTGNLCLSVRNIDAVSHYLISWDGSVFQIGPSVYRSVSELAEFFSCPGFIDGEETRITLGTAYPRDIYEKHLYEKATLHVDWLGAGDKKKKKKKRVDSAREKNFEVLKASTESKEGYLTKLGHVRKNWKVRWFVVNKNEFRYYRNKGDAQPIRVLDLCFCSRVERTTLPDKQHAFCVAMPSRTYLMYATTDEEADAWVEVLQTKVAAVQARMAK